MAKVLEQTRGSDTVVLVAFLVNRFATKKSRHIRRAVILAILFFFMS